jgi:hypothetical protein
MPLLQYLSTLTQPPPHCPDARTAEAPDANAPPQEDGRVPTTGALRALVEQLLQDPDVRDAIQRVFHTAQQGSAGALRAPARGPEVSPVLPAVPGPLPLDAHVPADAGVTLLDTYAHVLMPVLAKLLAAQLDAVAGPTAAPLPAAPFRVLPLPLEEYLYVLSAAHYQAVREVLAHGAFALVDGSPWPTARLAKGRARGHAQLRPVVTDQQPFLPPEEVERWTQIMARQRGELSDLDADTLDALSAIWLYQANDLNDAAVADVDDLLSRRGLTRHLGGHGRRGGYMTHQRTKMLQSLAHIQNLWLTMTELETYDGEEVRPGRRRRTPNQRAVQSRAFVITDLMGQLRLDGFVDVEKFIFRPGQVFAYFLAGPGRQTALLSAKALQYDPYRQKWEKRLTRYLSWQWRCTARSGNYLQPFAVTTLLTAVGGPVNHRRLSEQREHLEHTLDTIQHDQVLATWQYAHEHADWPKSTMLIEPPDPIREQYQHLEWHEAAKRRRLPAPDALGERLKRRRQALGLSQIQAAEQLGLHQGYFSRLERCHATPSPAVCKRLENWCTRDA